MITITKEKNIMKIEVSGTSGYYAFDVNTGVFYGKKGNPIKKIPSHGDISRAFSATNTQLGLTIARIINWNGVEARWLTRNDYVKAYIGADKVDGLALGVKLDYSPEDYEYINDNFTAFVKYARECLANGEFDYRKQRRFRQWCIWEKGKSALGQYAEHITEDIFRVVTNCGNRVYSTEEWGAIAYYLVRCKVWEYHNHDCTKICEYIDWCRAIGKTPNRQNNFMREYLETKKEYELRKTEFDNNTLRRNYEEKAKAFTFTFGNYSVVVPTCTKDIIDEGANMHHCVGGYVNRVVNGDTYIVFVRRTDTPNECYITAQVEPNGKLNQYYLAYDRNINSIEDIEFYNAFAEHLKENW